MSLPCVNMLWQQRDNFTFISYPSQFPMARKYNACWDASSENCSHYWLAATGFESRPKDWVSLFSFPCLSLIPPVSDNKFILTALNAFEVINLLMTYSLVANHTSWNECVEAPSCWDHTGCTVAQWRGNIATERNKHILEEGKICITCHIKEIEMVSSLPRKEGRNEKYI
jgi:hypothetical protein